MIKNKVEQLNNPYGQVTYETFRARRQAFVDKTGIIESLDDEGTTPYPVLLVQDASARAPSSRCSSASMIFHTKTDMIKSSQKRKFMP